MTFTVRIRTLPGSPMMCEYECPSHGRFEHFVTRDVAGDPPEAIPCPIPCLGADGVREECSEYAALVISAPAVKFWSRDPVAIGRASKSDEKDPRALDTEPLATGKMTKPEWQKWQRGISNERRYQKRLKSGRLKKRIQVGGG